MRWEFSDGLKIKFTGPFQRIKGSGCRSPHQYHFNTVFRNMPVSFQERSSALAS